MKRAESKISWRGGVLPFTFATLGTRASQQHHRAGIIAGKMPAQISGVLLTRCEMTVKLKVVKLHG